jgi:hypothetical protein
VKNYGTGTCAECTAPFSKHTANVRFCSHDCKLELEYRRRRERRAAARVEPVEPTPPAKSPERKYLGWDSLFGRRPHKNSLAARLKSPEDRERLKRAVRENDENTNVKIFQLRKLNRDY